MPLDHAPQRARLSAVGTAAGVALGLAGIGEARSLAMGDERTLIRSARTLGPVGTSAVIDGAESVVVLDAIRRGQLDRIPAAGFAAADVGGALVAAGVQAQRQLRRLETTP